MKSYFQLRCFASLVFVVTLSAVFSLATQAQDGSPKEPADQGKLTVGTFKEGLAKAKANGMPLVIFGMTDT